MRQADFNGQYDGARSTYCSSLSLKTLLTAVSEKYIKVTKGRCPGEIPIIKYICTDWVLNGHLSRAGTKVGWFLNS